MGAMYFDNLAKRRNDVSGQAGAGTPLRDPPACQRRSGFCRIPHSGRPVAGALHCWITSSTVSRSGIS